jgi:DNA modification methylase
MYADLAEAAELYRDDAKEIVEDEIPEPPVDPITRPGDLWLLGDHRLLCGDSTKADDVERLMAGAKADMMFTDPPYGVSYVGKTKKALTIQNDGEEDLPKLLDGSFAGALLATREGACWYVAAPPGPLHWEFARRLMELGVYRQTLVWVKDAMVLGHSHYHYKHEPIFYGWKPGASHREPPDRTQVSVWEIARPKRSEEHPTMKPVELVAKAIGNSSLQDESVYEPFCGSGTTLIAAEQLGRKCYGMEISPQYCDVIVKRWETLTGKKAELEASNGQARPTQRADDPEDRQGQPRQKAAQQKRAKAAKR